MLGGPALNFWRPPIDNDMYVLPDWRKAHLDRLSERIDHFEWKRLDQECVEVRRVSRIAPPVYDWGFRRETTYMITSSGLMIMDVKGEPIGTPPAIFAENRIANAGRGRHGTCPVVRQRTWGKLPGQSGSGTVRGIPRHRGRLVYALYLSAGEWEPIGCPLDLACGWRGNGASRRWRARPELQCEPVHRSGCRGAAHASDLVPRSFITLNLDYRQNGLGGNRRGPAQAPEHSIKPEPFSFRILLMAHRRGYRPGTAEPADALGSGIIQVTD